METPRARRPPDGSALAHGAEAPAPDGQRPGARPGRFAGETAARGQTGPAAPPTGAPRPCARPHLLNVR